MKIADQVKRTVEEIIACPDVNGLYSLSSVNLFDFALDRSDKVKAFAFRISNNIEDYCVWVEEYLTEILPEEAEEEEVHHAELALVVILYAIRLFEPELALTLAKRINDTDSPESIHTAVMYALNLISGG